MTRKHVAYGISTDDVLETQGRETHIRTTELETLGTAGTLLFGSEIQGHTSFEGLLGQSSTENYPSLVRHTQGKEPRGEDRTVPCPWLILPGKTLEVLGE